MAHVIVVGGGVIGLAAACTLRMRGADVTVVERGRIGGGASRGNAGQICPDLAVPLPSPKVLRDTLTAFVRGHSPLRIRAFDGDVLRFLTAFAASSRRLPYERGLRAISSLASLSVPALRELQARGLDTPISEAEYLETFSSVAAAEAARDSLLARWRDGGAKPGPVQGHDALSRLEPVLSDAVRAGFLVPGQLSIMPGSFIDALGALALRDGVAIREGVQATSIAADAASVTVTTSNGPVRGTHALVASGVWSGALLRPLGVRLPIVAGKGFSFSVTMADPPKRPIMLQGPHVAVLPLGDRTRISGCMVLDPIPDRFDPARIDEIVRAATPYLRGVAWSSRRDEWVGPRPLTPTGLPFLGAIDRNSRVFVATGHNMYGVTLAPATGRVMADLICGTPPVIDLGPFAPRAD